MNYYQAIDTVNSLIDYEKAPASINQAANYDLGRVYLLLENLGNPHQGRITIHIAGTKGKGSTAAMTASILSNAGLSTGLYTSPHLNSWQERIAMDGKHISQSAFASQADKIWPLIQRINNEAQFGKITSFEMLTAMAFQYFQEKKAAAQVLETGLGGRLDATNVCIPDVCIITSLSLDHTQVLGDTLEEIAREKAGIIKPHCPVICAPQTAEVLKIIEEKCMSVQAKLVYAGRDITWQFGETTLTGQSFTARSKLAEYSLRIPLLGEFQLENAALAIGAAEALTGQGVKIGPRDIEHGLRVVRWPARFQILQKSPLIVIDGAHNMYSLQSLVNSLRKYLTFKKVFIIFGASEDKDIEGMSRTLSMFADKIVLVTSGHPRAANADYLQRSFAWIKDKISTGKDIDQSLEDTLSIAGAKDLILVTGSLFLAAEAATAYAKTQRQRTPPTVTDEKCSRALRQ